MFYIHIENRFISVLDTSHLYSRFTDRHKHGNYVRKVLYYMVGSTACGYLPSEFQKMYSPDTTCIAIFRAPPVSDVHRTLNPMCWHSKTTAEQDHHQPIHHYLKC